MKERKARVEDGLSATRAAVEEGVVPGGGVALLRCQGEIDKIKFENPDEEIGGKIVRKALEAPIRQIAENSGLEGSVVCDYVKRQPQNIGFNAEVNKYEDLVKAGILDPTKVVRTELENGASIGALLVTTEVAITDIPEKKETPPMMPPGGGGYGGGGGMY